MFEQAQQRSVGVRVAVAAIVAMFGLPFTWAVTAAPAHGVAIVIANADSYNATEDTPLTVDAPGVLGNDTDISLAPAPTAVLVAQASHGTVDLAADGSFTYTPAQNANGTDTFTYREVDGTDMSDPATVTITIAAVNDPPVAANDAYRTPVNAPLSVDAPGVLTNDTDVDGDSLTAAIVAGPGHSSAFALHADGSFDYTPVTGYRGPDSFTYKANDGTADSNTATVALQVNALPVANTDTYGTNEDTPLAVTAPGVLTNDTDADGNALTAVVVAGPSHASAFALNSDGSFTYTPAANFNGPDSFTYKADDGLEQSSAATVTINVASVNDVPVANDDSYTVPANETSSISPPGVITNDTDADGDTLTVASHTNTSHGSLIVNVGGSFTYTPFTNYTGPDSFTYTATDGTATSAPATVTINVSPLVGDDLEQYIRGVYQVILGRAPEPSALAYWRAQLAGGLDPAAFTGFLEFSQEAAGDEVAIAYAVILQRPVDPAGLSYWRNLLDNGVTLQDVEATLAGSQEFFNRNGGTNPGAIAQMYRIFLGREPDGGGLVYWTTQLNAGEPRGDVARSLLHSDEGIHRALELAYQVDLHRDVDAQGEAYWRQFLQTGDFRVVLAVLPASYEFAVLVTSG